jgi:5'-3' exonuclease
MNINIIDGNNYVIHLLQRDPSGLAARTIFTDVINSSDFSIFVFDPVDGLAIRRALYPGYKVGRIPPTDNVVATFDLVKELLGYTNAVQVCVPGYEADDTIATLVRTQVPQARVVSTDRDFWQLGVPVIGANPLVGVEAHYVRLYKAVVGDRSDRIPGVRLFGDKAWEQCDKAQLYKLVAEGEEVERETLGLSEKMLNLLYDNLEQVRTFYEIVGFYDVPAELISKHTRVGKTDVARGDARLREFML